MVGLGVSNFSGVLGNSIDWCGCWLVVVVVVVVVVSWSMDWSWRVVCLSQLWVVEDWVGWETGEGALVSGKMDLLLVLNLGGVNWSD